MAETQKRYAIHFHVPQEGTISLSPHRASSIYRALQQGCAAPDAEEQLGCVHLTHNGRADKDKSVLLPHIQDWKCR